MPSIKYVEKKLSADRLRVIIDAGVIIEEYQKDGYVLTLRQLYYQFVSRGWLENTQAQYKRLGAIVNDARLAGLIDWEAIEDRTRRLSSLSTWDSPQEIIRASADQFRFDKWKDQSYRIEVWIEKEALAGVFEKACEEYEIPFMSCRGYGSQSMMWRAAQRLRAYEEEDQEVHILYFGDHDPSGIDMTRDIRDRLKMFKCRAKVQRMALNMDQVRLYSPPPNPAKVSDSRSPAYIKEFGNSSWELDALDPSTLAALVNEGIDSVIDKDVWTDALDREKGAKDELNMVAKRWNEIVVM